jgi:phosphopentomutase
MKPRSFGRRKTFADIGQTIAQHLAIPKLGTGTSWL